MRQKLVTMVRGALTKIVGRTCCLAASLSAEIALTSQALQD